LVGNRKSYVSTSSTHSLVQSRLRVRLVFWFNQPVGRTADESLIGYLKQWSVCLLDVTSNFNSNTHFTIPTQTMALDGG
jgi:hypothetical protein